MRYHLRLVRLLSSTAAVTVVALALAGCQTTSMSDITGSIRNPNSSSDVDPRAAAVTYGERFRANPKDVEAALRYGQALRSTGQREQAVAVFEQATLSNPGNKPLLAAYGRALADNGNLQRAFDVLSSAHTPANPDWKILSAQGAVLDQMNRHDEARQYYASALKIRPEEPSVLSNLGLSYMLTKDLPHAEEALRRAYGRGGGDPRVRQNLGLVVGLQGRFSEAENIVKGDLPPEEAAANVAYLRQMLSRQDNRQDTSSSSPHIDRQLANDLNGRS